MLKKLRLGFRHWFILGLCLTLLSACATSIINPKVDSFETANKVLRQQILPKISIETALISDQIAQGYTTDNIQEQLPELNRFPLYAARPSNNPNVVYIELFSSSEKANVKKQNERWLVEVAKAFNQKRQTTSSGKVIQVGVRKIPSGTAARMLAARKVEPAGYSPSNDLWVAILESQGLKPKYVARRLVPNTAGIVIRGELYRDLASAGEVTFERLLDAIASGKLTIGYPNPYSSSTALNLLYTLFWRAAGHHQNRQPLTIADLKSPQVNSVFRDFQKQVLVTTTTTLDLQEIFIRDKEKLQAFPLEYQNYQQVKKIPGFETSVFVPFGIPHNNPLVGFEWNTPEQQQALRKFAQFASSTQMQQLAQKQGFITTDYLKGDRLPPIPAGEVLKSAQSYWKQQKDLGSKVYLMTVIDTSGSMEGKPLEAVKEGLRVATEQINPGNYVGLITFSDRPTKRVTLAPFNTMQQKRLLAAIDYLRADGQTAMYDAMMVGLAELMELKEINPDGRFYLLVLTDGQTNKGFEFKDVKDILAYSGIRFYPIAYGNVNQAELEEIAALRESTVKKGTPENVQSLLKSLFQTSL